MSITASTTILRLGTRGSLLARVQSQMVADELEKRHPGLRVELCIFKTSGDQIADRPLHQVGGKGLFTKELEQALLAGQVDLAVHSFKDVPVTMPLVDQAELMIAAVPAREDPRDVLVCQEAKRIQDLRPGAKVGTGSLRRRAQLLALRPDLQVEGIRGNIDTRVRKLRHGAFDAVILALAGLKRSGLFDASIMQPIPLTDFLPAAGQGALALQCRRNDQPTRQLLAAVHDEPSATCVRLEREVVRRLEGDCFSPIAAFATIANQKVELRVAVGKQGGELPVLSASAQSDLTSPDTAVAAVLAVLSDRQIRTHLHG
ncbi:MAG TPA: hydroxymethylbilane synthase [Tepidisphaeraceae bacterium]|nr:hydroxymethylbilane synthase [Tepidisphaeraceae bacterium]